ncbi:MAG: hypothetical protein AAGE76_07745 [Pseudomonadota bacterium]
MRDLAKLRVELDMPAWVPAVLHTPARMALGLAIGLGFGAYGVALAVSLNRVVLGLGVPELEVSRLLALGVGAWLLRLAVLRWAARREADARRIVEQTATSRR